MKKFTAEQQKVIDYRGKRLLVSASAGTGKTTVMIQRILSLIADGADISQFVVVTFTNLAAAEMKARLSAELAAVSNDRRMVEQLERLDNANISTIHSFCSELLRNYFYLVDIDPGFTIPDSVTVANLKKAVLDDLFAEYFAADDEAFAAVHKIFSKNRQESNFKDTVLSLYEFARGLENFSAWYSDKRVNFVEYSADNPVVKTLLGDIADTCAYLTKAFADVARRFDDEHIAVFADICRADSELLGGADYTDLQQAVNFICTAKLAKLPAANTKKAAAACDEVDVAVLQRLRADFDSLTKAFDELSQKYQKLFRGMTVETLWQQNVQTVAYTDKLVEIVNKFDQNYFAAKKQRGFVDFGDLEHLALAILRNQEALTDITGRYKYVFVDEYQDTSPIQEEIVKALGNADLFMVGDVKQSIYGFRGCEPQIFLDKYNSFKSGKDGCAIKLNTNFRTNNQIFDFVNDLFCYIMTENFGKVDYRNDAMLEGPNTRVLPLPSVLVNLVCPPKAEKPEVSGMYDITRIDKPEEGVTQAKIVAANVAKFVGTKYVDKDGAERTIGYGDIVVLTRSLKDKAIDIYDALVEANIPVVANFKVDGYESKEVRDLVNLLRMLDNPYNDVYTVGVCLSCFGKFTENDLGAIRLDTAGRVPFYTRLRVYADSYKDSEITQKINTLLNFVDKVRFLSVSSTVCETLLYVMKLTDYELYVSGLPNGGLRVRKLYAFIESVRAATYAESVDKFLEYIDESDNNAVEEGVGNADAVRIMTMHASKGLEFPIVIVAATESRFNMSPEAVERNVELGLAVNYYDFDTMRVSASLGAVACGMFNKTKQREEEMRLLYVALTRAKYLLNVVGNVTQKQLTDLPKQPQKANTHMDWVMSMLRANYVGTVSTDKLTVEVNTDLPETKKAEAVSVCEQYTDLQAVLDKMNYAYEYRRQVNMPLKVVSSALDKEALEVAEALSEQTDEAAEVLVDDYIPEEVTAQAVEARPNNGKKSVKDKIPKHIADMQAERNKVGTAYHKVLQFVPCGADEQQIRAVVNQLVDEEKIDKIYADQLQIDVICNIVNNADFVKICGGGKVYKELPFMLSVPYNQLIPASPFTDEVMLQGVIDLLVTDGKRAVVVDYKYTKHADTVRQRYAAQLNSYVMAVRQIFGITDVDCYILSISDAKLIKM